MDIICSVIVSVLFIVAFLGVAFATVLSIIEDHNENDG